MATRQYIGARYVPKFYQNSVDGSTQWEANVVYEPLMYVTLTNGHMYISKKQVPATVGSPVNNIDYWLDIGSYNGFIEQLQNEIDTINNVTIPAIQNDVADKQDAMDNNLTTTDKTVVGAINELVSGKQDKTDNTLTTTSKTVVGAINELDGEIGDLSTLVTSDKTSVVNAINSLSAGINKRYVLIMDSYGTYPDTTLIDAIKEKLNIADDDAIAQGGIGFTNVNGQGTFESLLTTNISQFVDKDKVDGVIVLGGANDYGGNLQNIRTAISSFCTYAKNQFVNAEIMIGCLSRAYQDRSNADAHKIAVNAYRSCFMYGARYLNNTEFIMHWKVLYYDFVHPAPANAPRIADAIYQAVVYGSCDIEYNASHNFAAKSLSGIFDTMAVTTGAGIDQHLYNGAGMFAVSGTITLTNSSAVNLQSQDIDLEETLADASVLFIGNASVPYRVSVPCIYRASLNDSEVRVGRCLLYIYSINEVHVKFLEWTPVSCDKVIIMTYTNTPVDVSYC